MVTGVADDTTQRSFYEKALSEAEQADLLDAMDVEGLEQEVAVLRLRLRTAMVDHPQDVALMLRGLDVLRRLVVTRYGLSRTDEDELREALASARLVHMEEWRGEGRQ
jgi:hypothetical protein